MATLIVPPLEQDETKIWATLGDDVAEWLERFAVWGPGSKLGQPVTIDDEFYGWLIRAYQVFPHSHPRAGRRRFDMASEEKAKGTGKTERAIAVGQAEFGRAAPVRCVDWVKVGNAWKPVGGPVPFPRLIFLASTEDQVQRTAFGRFKEALKRSPLADEYHITTDRIVLLGDVGAAGEAYPLPVSPDSADGDLPTWQHVDEPHRWTLKRHHEMLQTISENNLKDVDADAWTMTTSTAGHTGEGSVEEELLRTAKLILEGRASEPGFFFVRRYAPDDMPLETFEDVEAAVIEARGPVVAEWSGDIPRIVARYFSPKTDKNYWKRVWLNQWVKGSGVAFDPARWAELDARPILPDGTRGEMRIPRGAFVGLGFDGARRRDSTGIVATDITTGLQEVLGVWERPVDLDEDEAEEWEVDGSEVDLVLTDAFERFDVWRFYGDPPYWDDWFPTWEGRWGTDRIHRWWTNREKAMAAALRRYKLAQTTGELLHDGHEVYARHVANAYRKTLPIRDEDDVELWLIRKDRHDSEDKIDLAMAGCLSWEVRMDALTAGAKPPRKYRAAGFGGR